MHALISTIRDRISHATATTLRRLAAARGRDPIAWLVGCGCVLVAAIVLGTVIISGEFRERAIANNERELQNAVRLLTRHFDQQFEDTEIIAADIISQMKINEITSPENFRARMAGTGAQERLKSKASALSYVGDVMIFDADGQLINTSGAWPVQMLNISNRAY